MNDLQDDVARRVDELEQLARDEQLVLPYPAPVIVMLEKAGFAVDLDSGRLVDERTRAGEPTDKALFAREYERALRQGEHYARTGDVRVFGGGESRAKRMMERNAPIFGLR